jgi:hypothetical protein
MHCWNQRCSRGKKKREVGKKNTNKSLTWESKGETVGELRLGFGDNVSTASTLATFGELILRVGEVAIAGA